MTDFKLNTVARDLHGKGASRRLRHANLVPAIVYGGTDEPQSVSISFKELVKSLESEAFYSQILTLTVAGKEQRVILKALQRHPAKGFPMHADFFRVSANQTLNVRVPLHYLNQDTAVGVKTQGGIVSIIANEVEVTTLPRNLPEFIEVDMADVELGGVLHLSDIKLPEGVTIAALELGHDNAIANIHAPIVPSENDDDVASDAEESAAEEGKTDGDKAE